MVRLPVAVRRFFRRMWSQAKIAGFCLCIIFAPSITLGAAESHLYLQETGTETHTFHWKLDVGEVMVITAEDEGATFINRCARDGATSHWTVSGRSRNIAADRRGNTIMLKGEDNRQIIEQILEIDEAPWFQLLSFSLRPLVLSEETIRRFWMIRPDTMAPVKLQAAKEGVEKLLLKGGVREARRVKVSACGLLSCLWSSLYWFDATTGLFLRYESTLGPPGTSKTVITLVDE